MTTANATIQERVAHLHAEASSINGDLQVLALSLVADMRFTLSEGWAQGLPDENSRVTQRERHTYSSASSCVKLLAREAARIEALENALRPFANIGVGTDPDYQPMIRMDRDAILAARAALGEGE